MRVTKIEDDLKMKIPCQLLSLKMSLVLDVINTKLRTTDRKFTLLTQYCNVDNANFKIIPMYIWGVPVLHNRVKFNV